MLIRFNLILFLCLIYSPIYPQKPVSNEIIFKADKKKYYHKEKLWELIGNPLIKNKQDTLVADSIKYFSDEKKGISVGNVKLYDHENTIEALGNYGEYYTESRYVKLITNTKLFVIKDDIIVHSDILERFGKKNLYIAKKNVKVIMEKDNATAVAEIGTYEIKMRKITLIGNPSINHEGTKYSADKIIIYTKTREIILEGNAEIVKANQKIQSEFIHYFSKDPYKKAVLRGNPKLIEYSSKTSLLGGKPYRIAKAKKIIYFNVQKGKAILTGKPKLTQYYVDEEKNDNNNLVRYLIYKREGLADKIKFIGGDNPKYALIGKAKVYDPYRAAFAKRIDYFGGSTEVAVLRGDPVIYEFYKKSEKGYRVNKLKRKGEAKLIKYYFGSEKMILKEDAIIHEKNIKITADYISYTGGGSGSGYAKGHATLKRKKDFARADLIKYFTANKKRIILYGNAYYENEELQAKANYIEHFEDIGKTVLKGNARVYDDDKEAFGENIVYTKKNGVEKAILKGSPSLIDDNRVIYGNIIEYTKDSKKELIFIDGKGKIIEKEKSVQADQIVYYTIKIPGESKDDEKMILTGHVQIEDKDKIIKGDNGEYYISNKALDKSEKGFLTGNCEILKKVDGQKAFSDTIDYFKNNKNKEKIVLKGNAEVNDETKTGYGDEIILYPNYNNRDINKFVLIGNPRIEDEVSIAVGEKIEIYDGLSNQVIIRKNGKYVNDEDDIEITAGLLVFDEDKDLLRAEKNPIFIQKKDKLTVYSNYLESYRKKKISIATGDVKIVQGKKKIYGERAKYFEKKKKLRVTGNASVVENNNVSRARKIILNTKSKKIRLIGIKKGQIDISK